MVSLIKQLLIMLAGTNKILESDAIQLSDAPFYDEKAKRTRNSHSLTVWREFTLLRVT